jgi:KaiC/GvpD/RAD55 family RecA-like ATPase
VSRELLETLREIEDGKNTLENYITQLGYKVRDNISVLIFPEKDEEVINSVYKYLKTFTEQFYFETLIVIHSVEIDTEFIKNAIEIPVHIIETTKEKTENIIRFINVSRNRMNNLKVCSLSRFPLENVKKILGFKGIDTDSLVRNIVLNMVNEEAEDEI